MSCLLTPLTSSSCQMSQARAHATRTEEYHLPRHLSPCIHIGKRSDMSTHTPYRTKLHNTKEIRLVRVSAGRWHDPIRCILIRRKLNNAAGQLPYRALSYVWGNSAVTDTIDLEELPFQITLNLSCALRHLRKVDGEILLWVDAIVSIPS